MYENYIIKEIFTTFAVQFKNKYLMANHKSAAKKAKQDAIKRLRNRFYKKSARTAIAKLRSIENKDEAQDFLPKVISMVDRLAKKNTWHKNKASNLKSKLMKFVAGLA